MLIIAEQHYKLYINTLVSKIKSDPKHKSQMCCCNSKGCSTGLVAPGRGIMVDVNPVCVLQTYNELFWKLKQPLL